jgi:hypothetical protein
MIALEGLGGIGTTQIALEAAFQVRETNPNCSVLRVPAVDVTIFENAYREIGQKLLVPGIQGETADVKTLIKKALTQSSDAWHLVIDNIDDTNLVFGDNTPSDVLPTNYKGSILFTTRTHSVIRKLDIRKDGVIRVENMNRANARALLAKSLHEDQISDSESTTKLLDFLADLPLAIRQASAYMDETGITTARYLEHCRTSDTGFIKILSKDFEYRVRYKSTKNPIATTWLISFRQVSEHNKLAAQFMRHIPFLAEKDIPQSILPTGHDGMDIDDAIGILRAYAFINIRPDKTSYDVHRLFQLVMRNWLTREGGLENSVTDVFQQLSHIFPQPKFENKPTWLRFLPHILTALTFQDHSSDGVARADILSSAGKSNAILGKYQDAEMMYRQALVLRIKLMSDERPSTNESRTSLASITLV